MNPLNPNGFSDSRDVYALYARQIECEERAAEALRPELISTHSHIHIHGRSGTCDGNVEAGAAHGA